MVDTDDTRRMTDDGRRTTPRIWHKLPTGELKIIYLRFLPINENFLQDLSTFFCSYVYIKPCPHLLEILNEFKLSLNCIYWQTEESRASVFLPIFEGSVSLWFPW